MDRTRHGGDRCGGPGPGAGERPDGRPCAHGLPPFAMRLPGDGASGVSRRVDGSSGVLNIATAMGGPSTGAYQDVRGPGGPGPAGPGGFAGSGLVASLDQ